MIDAIHTEFPQHNDLIYLNHAAVAPWPQRTHDAVMEFARENISQGAADYPGWMKLEQRLRRQLRDLLGAASVEEIALVKNTSEALSFIAYGLDWQAGDTILTSAEEFPSNMIPWESLADQGVEIQKVDLQAAEDPTEALLEQINADIRLLTISSIQYASGTTVDLNRLGAACQEHDILFCVDAIQSLGAFPFDVKACQADFVVADGHKWMLGPEGLGVFYCRKSRLDSLSLNEYGWHMVEAMGQYDIKDWRIASSARRFECGSPNMLGAHALSASLSLILELGLDEISRRIKARTDAILEEVSQRPELMSTGTAQADQASGIVVFNSRHIEAKDLHPYLMSRRVICALRGGGVRFSPHFYTPLDKIKRAFEIIDQYPQTS